jgi:hypothetical protein
MSTDLERQIARLERDQHGVVTTGQLHELKLSKPAIQRRANGARHDRV